MNTKINPAWSQLGNQPELCRFPIFKSCLTHIHLRESLLTPPPIERPDKLTPPPPPEVRAEVTENVAVNVAACPDVAMSVDAFLAVEGHESDLETIKERQLRQFSGLLFSLIAHLAILVLLALVLIPNDRSDPLVISLAAADKNDPWANTEELSSMESVDFAVPDQETLTPDSALTDTVEIDLVELMEVEPPSFSSMSVAPADAPIEALADPGDTGEQNKSIKFFGAEAYGNRFVFVLDVSSSMAARNGQRLERATRELIGSINQLTAEQDFSVILYSNHALPMFVKNNEAVMRQATPINRQAAIDWLGYQVRPNGGTMPARALQIAGSLKPDAVFFLSDGEFLYGHGANLNSPLNSFFQNFGQARKAMPPPGGEILDPKVVLSEYPPEIVVHTIAFESFASGPLMQLIAKEKGGQYRFIPPP